MKDIINILLKELTQITNEQMDIRIELSTKAKEYIIDKAYDKKYGARPLKRTLQNLLEDKLAEYILDGKIKEGEDVFVDMVKDEKVLVFNPKELVNV